MRRDAIARHRPYSHAPSVPQGKTVSEFEAAMGRKKKKIKMETKLPYDIFSQSARHFCEYVTDLYSCPQEYVVASMVLTVGVAMGKRARITDGQYTNYPNLFVALVGRSGINKSTPLTKCTQPLWKINSELLDAHKEDLHRVRAENKHIKAENKKRPEGDKIDFIEEPKPITIIGMDSTPEERNKILGAIDQSPHSFLICWDELPSLFKQFGRYNANSEMEDLMTLFDNRHYIVSRKGDGIISIDNPVLSITGTIQTGAIKLTFAKEGMLINGFNPRWLFVYPDNTTIPMKEKKRTNPDAENWWSSFILGRINKMQERLAPLQMTDDALDLYINWCNQMRSVSNTLDENDVRQQYQAAVFSKMEIQCARWALSSHFLSDNIDSDVIGIQEMDYSIRCMEYFKATALKVLNLLTKCGQNGSPHLLVHSPHQGSPQSTPSSPQSTPVSPQFTDTEKRIIEAYNKAKEDGTSIRQLAEILGFNSTSHIYRVLRKYGTTAIKN